MAGRFFKGAAASLVFVVAACGGGSSGSSPRDSSPPDDSASPTSSAVGQDGDVAAMQSEVDEFVALAPEQQLALLGERTLDFDVAVAEESGLADALGGADEARAALAADGAAFVETAQSITPESLHPMSRRASVRAEPPSIAGGLFGGYMLVAIGARSAVEGTNDGAVGTRSLGDEPGTTKNGGSFDGDLTATDQSVKLTFNGAHTGAGVTTTIKTITEVQPCPDTEGRFAVDATVDVSAKTTGGSSGQEGTLEVHAVGRVDDDANLLSDETVTKYEMHWGGFGMGSFVDVSGSIGGPGGGSSHLDDFNWFTTKPEHFTTTATIAPLFAVLISHFVIDAAMGGVQSGRCIQLDVAAAPGPTGLEPGSTSTITAAPKAKRDGNPAGGTVTASLTGGGKSVEPASTKVPANAEFTFNAPDERNQTGTVALEARSRRGVGKATITFDTKSTSYVASGAAAEATFSGEVASITEPFVIDIEFAGGDGAYSFSPKDEHGGTVSISGSGGGATISGDGTYTVVANDDGTITLTVDSNSCVDVSGACRQQTALITLTPKSP